MLRRHAGKTVLRPAGGLVPTEEGGDGRPEGVVIGDLDWVEPRGAAAGHA
jgi:hypothetical protein